ncbi:MAG: amidohydrolase [Phycisphaerae bacterium]|nr:amidohydrolase [Phycisphaerae bacterium]
MIPTARFFNWCLIAAVAVFAVVPDVRAEGAPSDDAIRAIDAHITKDLPAWFEFYKVCHANPELSLHEKESSERIAEAFARIGLKVTRHVGGFGVVGMLENGPGPVLLIRGDMDALPVVEETGLPYASKVLHTETDGSKVGVMHACGHDMHMTVLVATAQTLAGVKDLWAGTIMFVAQPAEEIGQGARLMLEDGLYQRFGTPNYALALHVSHELKVGTIGYSPEWALANVDSVDITIHGRGGHGAYPHQTVDPIVTASQLVLALQTIVSRRLDPRDTAVVTVGSIHGGTKHNVIPETVTLQLTVRSYTNEVRKKLLDSIRQIAIDTCKAAACPKPPDVRVVDEDFTPAVFNDPELSDQIVGVFERVLGAPNVIRRPPSMGGEDFSRYSRDAKGVKGFIYWLGVIDDARFAAAQQPNGPALPSIHSSTFRPDPEPSIRTGVRTMSAAALSILSK